MFELIHLKRNGLMSIVVCGRDVFCHLCYLTYTSTTWQTILKTYIGVSFGNEKICILLYADDIVLLAETIYKWYLTHSMTGAVLMI